MGRTTATAVSPATASSWRPGVNEAVPFHPLLFAVTVIHVNNRELALV